MRSRLATPLAAAALAVPLALAVAAAPAQAAPADKPQLLSSWTQTSASSYDSWATARNNQASYSAYGFDWSTDYCTTSPDNPFGFPFQMSCARHDFGYRNYKAAGSFDADLKRVCTAYSGVKRTSCDASAWTYYQAVDKLG